MSETSHIEQLASQDSMQTFYDTMRDRIVLDGVDEYFSNFQLDMAPLLLCLEDDDFGYEIRICRNSGLEISLYNGETDTSGGTYFIEFNDSGDFFGRHTVEVDEEDVQYPLTETGLNYLIQKIRLTRPISHTSGAEILSRLFARDELAFAQNATVEEMQVYVALFDLLKVSSGKTSILREIADLQTQVQRRRAE